MRGWLFVFRDVRREGGCLSSVMLGEGVVVCGQRCEERRWLFVFSDVRREVAVCLQRCEERRWLFVFSYVR